MHRQQICGQRGLGALRAQRRRGGIGARFDGNVQCRPLLQIQRGVRGARLAEHLDLLGTAVSLGGPGELDTAGEYVKFDVYTIWSQTLQRWLTTPSERGLELRNESFLKLTLAWICVMGAGAFVMVSPLMIRYALPGLSNLWVSILKDSSLISVVGFMLLGFVYLHMSDDYVRKYPQALSGYQLDPEFEKARDAFDLGGRNKLLKNAPSAPYKLGDAGINKQEEVDTFNAAYTAGKSGQSLQEWIKTYPKEDKILAENQSFWLHVGLWGSMGLDLRPAWTCFIGIILAIALNKATSYYTHTSFEPVKSLAKACQTGHATNIIQGLAVGYESAVVATLVIALAILLSVLIYAGSSPIFIAYGVAMCGIGMLTLTGNTISMDVFGPVADNANGVGEMGYDRDEMGPENYRRARQILADLDAVGNTTKAETKGIAIGSAVIAAVSLFASFIAVLAVKSEANIGQMTTAQFLNEAGKLSVAEPIVFIGALVGGVVPLLFSSMLIRAVGRAAFLIVKECRAQFRDPEIWQGTKVPDYGRVVNICTSTAQAELIGPGLLAILTPILVGIFLGPQALGGYLAGMIVVGQLLAVFMANAGGAWDNAKKSIEDGLYGGKGSEAHKASVTGDTVGDPLKDTAGPALNPLIKVMNMVSLLAIGPIVAYSGQWWLYAVGVLAIAGVAWAIWRSKTESKEMKEVELELAASSASEPAKAMEPVGSGK